MTRLGLWGPGSAFPDFNAFLESMKKRGVSFLEVGLLTGPPNQGVGVRYPPLPDSSQAFLFSIYQSHWVGKGERQGFFLQ
jgi:P-loop containing NTP hydrolase pore-1